MKEAKALGNGVGTDGSWKKPERTGVGRRVWRIRMKPRKLVGTGDTGPGINLSTG